MLVNMKKNNFGKYKIEIVGLNLENFLFDVACAGITLWKVKKHKNCIIFVVHGQNYTQICKIAEKFEQKVIVLKKYGVIETLKKFPYCIGAVLGIIISAYFVWTSAYRVTSVEYEFVDHNQVAKVMTQEQLTAIEEYLLSVGIGTGKRFVGGTKNIENQIVGAFDFVENCSISKVGSKIVVRLKEAAMKERESVKQIVSSCDGIVQNIVVLSGKAKVKAGDIVKKGQVLVSEYDGLPAKAEILIKSWKVGTSIYFEKQQEVVRTGRTQVLNSVVAFSKTIIGFSSPRFDTYEIETKCNMLGNLLPIYIQTAILHETKIVEKVVPFEEQKELVMQKAKQNALDGYDGNYEACTYSVVSEGGITRVDCYLQITQNIVEK